MARSKRSAIRKYRAFYSTYHDAAEAALDEFLCPITRKLPIDPVLAEDGIIYERKAIEQWFTTQRDIGSVVKSPSLHRNIGRVRICIILLRAPLTRALCQGLIAALAVKNAIEKMINGGLLIGEKAREWKNEMSVHEVYKKAEAGEASSMWLLGTWLSEGANDISQDLLQAFHWFRLCANKGYTKGMTSTAQAYLDGKGVQQSTCLGLYWATRAAESGSEHAHFLLGYCFSTGNYTVPVDHGIAREWYTKMRVYDCLQASAHTAFTCVDSDEKSRELADKWLQEHPATQTTDRRHPPQIVD